jgi:hypothetical protein
MWKRVDVLALAAVCCLVALSVFGAADKEKAAPSVPPLETKVATPSVISPSTADDSATIVPSEARDPAFERLVDLGLLRSAVDSGDASQLTDVALQFLEGERILLRPHRDITAEQLLRLAGKAAVVKQDRRSLERVVKASKAVKNETLTSEMEAALKTVSESRAVDRAQMVPVNTPIEVFMTYQELIKAIERARILGEKESVDALEKQLAMVRGLSKEQAEYLKRVMNSARSSMPEKPDPTTESLKKLGGESRSWVSKQLGISNPPGVPAIDPFHGARNPFRPHPSSPSYIGGPGGVGTTVEAQVNNGSPWTISMQWSLDGNNWRDLNLPQGHGVTLKEELWGDAALRIAFPTGRQPGRRDAVLTLEHGKTYTFKQSGPATVDCYW